MKVCLVAACLNCASVNVYAQNCDGFTPARIFHVNEINTPVIKAYLYNLSALRTRFETATGLVDCFSFEVTYNENEPVAQEVLEVYLRFQSELIGSITNAIFDIIPLPRSSKDGLITLARFLEPSTYVVDDDLNEHVNTYASAINSGAKVILVPHSQGNYYANDAYERLFGTTENEAIK